MSNDRIENAKDKTISEFGSGLPDVGGGVQLLLQPFTAIVMQKEQVDGLTQEIPVSISTKGSIQPFTPQQLEIRPEGQRAWKWFTLYCLKDLNMMPDDVFKIKRQHYRVMDKSDWSDFGFFRYGIIEDYLADDTDEQPDNSGLLD